jgi:hypothetical protein
LCSFAHKTLSGLSHKADSLLEKVKKQDAHEVEESQEYPIEEVMKDSAKEELNEEITIKLQCAICIAIMNDPMTATPCMHNFCKVCIEQWMNTSSKKECPMCKVKIQDLKMNSLVANIIQVITKKQ